MVTMLARDMRLKVFLQSCREVARAVSHDIAARSAMKFFQLYIVPIMRVAAIAKPLLLLNTSSIAFLAPIT